LKQREDILDSGAIPDSSTKNTWSG